MLTSMLEFTMEILLSLTTMFDFQSLLSKSSCSFHFVDRNLLIIFVVVVTLTD